MCCETRQYVLDETVEVRREGESMIMSCPQAAQVNYFGTARCTRMALPYMRDSADGIKPERPHIINVSATAGLVGLPFAGLTCTLRAVQYDAAAARDTM